MKIFIIGGSGPEKILFDCYGQWNIENHKNGEPVLLPKPEQTLIGPCDAEDVARRFYLSIMQPSNASDEIFNVGSNMLLH